MTGYKHGMKGTKTYNSWRAMKKRCSNKNYEHYGVYGGRGISVCDKWQNSFIEFFNDMGERPSGCTLDRKDPDKGYSKDNCRWASSAIQANNKSRKLVNKTGYTGVYKRNRRYIALIMKNKKAITLGTYDCKHEAAMVYALEKEKYVESLIEKEQK